MRPDLLVHVPSGNIPIWNRQTVKCTKHEKTKNKLALFEIDNELDKQVCESQYLFVPSLFSSHSKPDKAEPPLFVCVCVCVEDVQEGGLCLRFCVC